MVGRAPVEELPVARARARYHDYEFNLVDQLLRPEVIITSLVLISAVVMPLLLPIGDLLADLRDSMFRALGVHVATVVLYTIAGVVLALGRNLAWLQVRPRQIAGILALTFFSAGVLAFWTPNVRIGGVDLHIVTAAGTTGRALLGWPLVVPWLASLFAGFAMLWPETAAEIGRTAPGAAARGTGAASLWVWDSVLAPSFRGASVAISRLRHRGEDWDEKGFEDEDYEGFEDDEEWDGAEFEDELEEDEEPAAVPEPAPVAKKIRRQIPMDLDQPVDKWRHSADGWQLPPLTLLEDPKAASKQKQADTQRRAQLIVDTLASFGVDSKVVEINEGPTVTQFGVEPGWDVKMRTVQDRDIDGLVYDEEGQPVTHEVEVSRTRIRVNRITSLQNDLALALAAPALRIEAPVPGKPVVGIEVPNTISTMVTMKQLMEGPAYDKFAAKADLPIALGAGVSGEPVMADLAKMPHLLIAGATGAGKSVCLNAIITGLLLRFSPNELRLVLVDPKRVELTPYANIPHLAFSNIIVDMDRVVGTLQAIINEMESRYRRFAAAGVRDLRRYNEVASKSGGVKLPYWVVVVDELADLMLVAPYQVENQIVRLAQLARATGIHLIIATQRPSVDVVTGLIKANFPTRIAFAMSSMVDSRTVLDQGGAEKLLGRGDMLFVPPGAHKPRRVQGVFLSDAEIEAVVDFWTADRFSDLVPDKHDDLLEEAEQQTQAIEEERDADPMVDRAVALVLELKTISVSMLQRRLRVGYPRAARIMDALEERGIVGPSDGSNSRAVVTAEGIIEAGDAGGSAPAIPSMPALEIESGDAEYDDPCLDAADVDDVEDEEEPKQASRRRRRGPRAATPARRRRAY